MTYDMSDLGPLYGQLGFETPAASVQLRLKAASAAAQGLTAEQFVPVLRAALGLPVLDDELAPFRSHFTEDPTFAPEISSPEMRLLAAGILITAMREWPASAHKLPLLAATGHFGGTRAPAEFPTFVKTAEDELGFAQETSASAYSDLAKPGAYAPTKSVESASAKATDNDMAGVVTDLGAAIGGLASHAANQDERLRAQINKLGQRVQQLSEQMQMQWWVANGFSEGVAMPFSKLPAAEVVIRSARELAGLTLRTSGVPAAPALLDQVLERAKTKKKLTLSALATGSPIDWRRSWVTETLTLPNAAICPVTYALKLATEANDQSDWEGRFQRELSVSPNMQLDALDWANQLYREALVTKALG